MLGGCLVLRNHMFGKLKRPVKVPQRFASVRA